MGRDADSSGDIPTAVESMETETTKMAGHIVKRSTETEAQRDAQKWSLTVKTPSLKVKTPGCASNDLVDRRQLTWS